MKKRKKLEKTISEIEKNISNARKIKNYLKGIKRDLSNLNTIIDNYNSESEADWIQGVINVQFVKNILPELFTEIKKCENIWEFREKYNGYSFQTIFKMYLEAVPGTSEWESAVNHIIYNIDVIDNLYIVTERKKYLAELYSDKAAVGHAVQYVECAQSYKDLERIIKICKEQKFENGFDKQRFLEELFSIMSQYINAFHADDSEFVSFSKQLVEWLKKSGLSPHEKRICVNAGHRIAGKVLFDNYQLLREILLILFPISKVEEIMSPVPCPEIDKLYEQIKKIDENSVFNGLKDENNKFLSIRNYYRNLGKELGKEKHTKIGFDIETMFINLNRFFELYQFWDEVGDMLSEEDSGNIASFQRYFDLIEDSVKENAFLSVSNLLQALTALKNWDEKTDYLVTYPELLREICYKLVLKYEAGGEWFEGKEKEVSKNIRELSEKVYAYDKIINKFNRYVVKDIKIYAFKFEKYCKLSE